VQQALNTSKVMEDNNSSSGDVVSSSEGVENSWSNPAAPDAASSVISSTATSVFTVSGATPIFTVPVATPVPAGPAITTLTTLQPLVKEEKRVFPAGELIPQVQRKVVAAVNVKVSD
jgi:hypothetical protein